MRWQAFAGWALAMSVGSSIFVAACGDDSSDGTTSPDAGDGSVDGDIPIVDAPFGLDARPANTTCLAPDRPTSNTPIKWEQVFAQVSIQQPMRLVQAPGDPSRFFVLERNGFVVSFPAANPSGNPTTVFDVNAGKANIADQLQEGGEGGMLGMAFHPGFAQNGQLFLSYTIHSATQPPPGGSPDMRSVITRVTSTTGGASFGQETTILGPFDQPASNHDGGSINFGLDGYLYIGFGDGGGGGDPFKHGQDTTSFFSKILRIDIDHGSPYAIPTDNPFANGGGAKEIFAYGFRNPFRWSFDRATGDLWVGDVGQDKYEEIDRVQLGGNYGWSKKEGLHCYNNPPLAGGAFPCPAPGTIDPIYEYPHPGVVAPDPAVTGNSITGGYVYRGKALPGMIGTYVFGDYVNQKIWGMTIDPSTGKPVVTQLNPSGPFGGWSSFAEDLDGEIYALDLTGAKIYKMVANPQGADAGAGADAGPPPRPFPQKLSQTGCFDASDPTKPAPGLIPYAVNSPLWSDGAEKARWIALPDGARIHVNADGDWEFPIGTVLVKRFSLAGKPVETRLFVRHADGGWAGYSYMWNDQGTDADLLPSNTAKQVGSQTWYFPSRAECMGCHSEAAGRSLGPEDGQLNGLFVYESTHRRSNQIATFEHIGLFDAPHPAPDQTIAFPTPTGTGDLASRARSYLQSNCSFCHRPQGPGGGNADWRYTTPLGDTKACGADAVTGDLGVAGLKVIAPGDPSHSAVSVRTHALDAKRMPPLGTRVVDQAGVGVLDSWIQSLTTCPAPTPDAGAKD